MIDSVLQRHTDPVILNNIVHPDGVTTEPKAIKKEIRKHFEEWTKRNSINEGHWIEWQDKYQPQTNINDKWYNKALTQITMQELHDTIQDSPNSKTTEP